MGRGQGYKCDWINLLAPIPPNNRRPPPIRLTEHTEFRLSLPMTPCPEPQALGLPAVFLPMMECVEFYYKPCFPEGVEWALKTDTWPTMCQNQGFCRERFFFLLLLYSIWLCLLLVALASYAVVLNIYREFRPGAAGKLFPWLLAGASFAAAEVTFLERSDLLGSGEGERLEHRGMNGALGPGRQGPMCVQLTRGQSAQMQVCPRSASGGDL